MKHNAFTIIGMCEGGLFTLIGVGFGVGAIFNAHTDKLMLCIIAASAYGVPGVLLFRRSKVSVFVMGLLGLLYLCAPVGLIGHKGGDDSVFSNSIFALVIFCILFAAINWIGFYIGFVDLTKIKRIV